jgi:transcriptional regulator with XRE-family HTH domain
MNLGNKIIELRKKNNLSQEELAEKVGVTRQTISKWELEETSPDIKQAKNLSKIFNIIN